MSKEKGEALEGIYDRYRRKLFDVRAHEAVIFNFEELVKALRKVRLLHLNDYLNVLDYWMYRCDGRMDEGTLEQIICCCERYEWRQVSDGTPTGMTLDWFPGDACREHLVCMTHGEPEEFIEYASDASRN